MCDQQEKDALLNYILTLLNIKASNDDEHKDLSIQMLVVLDFVKDKFGDLTAEEIKQAFKMYVAKEFPQIKVFRILDSIVVGEVLNAYREYRNEALRTYSHKKKLLLTQSSPVSESEKKEIRQQYLKLLFEELKQKEYCYETHRFFLPLEANGKIVITAEEKKKLYEDQLEIYIPNETQRLKNRSGYSSKFELKELQAIIEAKQPINAVVNICRAIITSKYLLQFTDSFESFKNQLNHE